MKPWAKLGYLKPLRNVRRRTFALLLLPGILVLNWLVQVAHKPSEIAGILEGGFFKNAKATWTTHGPTFRENATDIISPELLAALAQVETRGNAIARTYWRFRWSWNPFAIYSPASTAVGLMQITDGTFQEASKFCIHFGKVVERRKWYDIHGCWFNGIYNRLVPSHATEMTSAYLHYQVERLVGKHRRRKISIEHQRDLAALIHLCGASRAEIFFRRGFASRRGELCGSHSVDLYLKRVRTMRRQFLAFDRPAFGPPRNVR